MRDFFSRFAIYVSTASDKLSLVSIAGLRLEVGVELWRGISGGRESIKYVSMQW